MLDYKLDRYKIVLASGSPRRQNFFRELDIDFSIDVREIEEIFPDHLKGAEITDYLAKLKATAFEVLSEKEIVITSDTIVWKDGHAIGKPKDRADAVRMLQNLSGETHEVYTSVCFTSKDFQKVVNDKTTVHFRTLSSEEINYYLNTCSPYDKAGSYGIQDWLGYIGIEKIDGCFFNVMGLPTRLVYKTLMEIAED